MAHHGGPVSLSAGEIVSATNALRRAADGFKPGAQITVQLISSAFAAVRRISELRRGGDRAAANAASADSTATRKSPEFERALAEYHAVLREWNQLLPRVHGWLLAEKARLEVQRLHAQSVNTWLEANKQTR